MASKKRIADRLQRLAYVLEDIAADLRHINQDSCANSVRAASSQIGAVGRTLREAS